MPWPSSLILIRVFPASCKETSMEDVPASRAFSTSSLMTEAGRSITSPAAILLMTSSLRMWTLDIVLLRSKEAACQEKLDVIYPDESSGHGKSLKPCSEG